MSGAPAKFRLQNALSFHTLFWKKELQLVPLSSTLFIFFQTSLTCCRHGLLLRLFIMLAYWCLLYNKIQTFSIISCSRKGEWVEWGWGVSCSGEWDLWWSLHVCSMDQIWSNHIKSRSAAAGTRSQTWDGICDTERCGWLKEQSLNHEACGFLCLFLLECLPAELRKLGLMVRNVSEVKSMKSQGPGAIVPIEIHWVYIILYTSRNW